MRKVFVSSMIMQPINPSTVYQSRDFDLKGKSFCLPISYLLDANIEAGDEVLIITGLTKNEIPLENYARAKKEMEEILKAHQASATFVEVDEPDTDTERDKQDSLTFSEVLKAVSDAIQDGDQIYADMTYGMKCYTLAMFIALHYAASACRDVAIKSMIYAQLYKGNAKEPSVSDIIDITTLSHINTIVSGAKPGQKGELDRFMGFLVG